MIQGECSSWMTTSECMMNMEEDHNNNHDGGGIIKREKTAAELRKSNKPLMERKRRERINNCLQQLKSILMEVTKKESSYYSKLEKADILEMTVKYLKNMKRQQLAVAMTSDPSVLGKYIAGFNECTTEVTKYLNSVDGLNTETRSRLLGHLANSLQRSSVTMATNTAVTNLQMSMNQQTAGNVQPLGIQIPAATQLSALPGSNGLCVLNQSTANAGIQAIPASAMQLVPAKLPTGELVFLLANNQSVCQQNNGLSVVSTVQNNVNNININPQTQSQVPTNMSPMVSISNIGSVVAPAILGQTQMTFPANISAMSPILLSTTKGLESPSGSSVPSGASTSGSSPESDISEASSSARLSQSRHALASSAETPHIHHDHLSRNLHLCSGDSDSSSDSDNNEEDIFNNNVIGQVSILRGPMWRPW